MLRRRMVLGCSIVSVLRVGVDALKFTLVTSCVAMNKASARFSTVYINHGYRGDPAPFQQIRFAYNDATLNPFASDMDAEGLALPVSQASP